LETSRGYEATIVVRPSLGSWQEGEGADGVGSLGGRSGTEEVKRWSGRPAPSTGMYMSGTAGDR
jgi:hypothetical protein